MNSPLRQLSQRAGYAFGGLLIIGCAPIDILLSNGWNPPAMRTIVDDTLSAENLESGGARFTIRLPLCPPAPALALAASAPSRVHRPV